MKIYSQRCSNKIFVPIPISSRPPQSSAFRRILFPRSAPKRFPNIEKAKDTAPMIIVGMIIDWRFRMPKQANDIPTAKASILVAIAKVRITTKVVGEKEATEFSSLKCS